jgi:mono/diheme cytochrome c family protein
MLAACGAMAATAGIGPQIVNDRQAFDEIARGHYMAILGDCSACHTRPGGKLYAGGERIDTPFGPLLAPNLTPDPETGIGKWSDEDFVDAVRFGRGRGGTHLYPAMPYTYYAKMSSSDVLAIRAYLNTLPPVHNQVAADQLRFPFNIRLGMVGWNALFFYPNEFEPVAGKSAEWNRGAFIVEGPGHCGLCHTAKNFLGADKIDNPLQGAVLQGWFSPDLGGDARTGLKSWSVDDIVSYLRKGYNRISAASGPMSDVIADSTSHMTDGDLTAIATYLKSLPTTNQTASTGVGSDDPGIMRAGRGIYADNCSACHTSAGIGEPNLFPPLQNSAIVQSANPISLINVVLHGAKNVATPLAPTAAAMPAFGWKLTDPEVAAVITYIRNSWGNRASAVSVSQVHNLRDLD